MFTYGASNVGSRYSETEVMSWYCYMSNLIGPPQQIAEPIEDLKSIGVDLILSGFLHFIEEVEYFGQKVLPLVRQLEAQQQVVIAAKSA